MNTHSENQELLARCHIDNGQLVEIIPTSKIGRVIETKLCPRGGGGTKVQKFYVVRHLVKSLDGKTSWWSTQELRQLEEI